MFWGDLFAYVGWFPFTNYDSNVLFVQQMWMSAVCVTLDEDRCQKMVVYIVYSIFIVASLKLKEQSVYMFISLTSTSTADEFKLKS